VTHMIILKNIKKHLSEIRNRSQNRLFLLAQYKCEIYSLQEQLGLRKPEDPQDLADGLDDADREELEKIMPTTKGSRSSIRLKLAAAGSSIEKMQKDLGLYKLDPTRFYSGGRIKSVPSSTDLSTPRDTQQSPKDSDKLAHLTLDRPTIAKRPASRTYNSDELKVQLEAEKKQKKI